VTAADGVAFADAAGYTYYEFVSYHQAPVSSASTCTHETAYNWDILQVALCKTLTSDAAACRADAKCTYNTVILTEVLGSEWYKHAGQKLTIQSVTVEKTHADIGEIECARKCIESTVLCAGVNWSATSEAGVTPPTGDCYLLPQKFDAADGEATEFEKDAAYIHYEFVGLVQ